MWRTAYAKAHRPSGLRRRVNWATPVSRRNGVALSDASRKTNAVKPVECSSSSAGLAPSVPVTRRATRKIAGAMPPNTSRGRRKRSMTEPSVTRSIVPAQVHPAVQRRDLICVAIEHQGGSLEEIANAPLARLAPARMIDLGIHVGVEAVLARQDAIPGRTRHLAGEADL